MRRVVIGLCATAALLAAVAPIGNARPFKGEVVSHKQTYSISCKAANVRNDVDDNTVNGVAYREDQMRTSKVFREVGTHRFISFGGVVTRADGRKVTGWVTAGCLRRNG